MSGYSLQLLSIYKRSLHGKKQTSGLLTASILMTAALDDGVQGHTQLVLGHACRTRKNDVSQLAEGPHGKIRLGSRARSKFEMFSAALISIALH